MRQLIYQTLAGTAEITAAVGTNIFTPNTLGTDPVPARPPTPFLIIAEQPNFVFQEVRKTSKATAQVFDIRCYDQRGDYLRIDDILRKARDTLLGVTLQVSPSGAKCIDVRWVGTSLDSEDPDLDMIFKAITMRFVTSI